jgi:hypothetical protein
VRVVGPLGDPDRLFCVLERLVEATEIGERQPEPSPRPSGKEARQCCPVDYAIVHESLHGFHEKDDGLRELADGEVPLGQPILRFDLEAHVCKFVGDVEGLLARFDCAFVVAHVLQPRSDLGEDETQPAPITDLPRQSFGFPHVVQDPAVLA